MANLLQNPNFKPTFGGVQGPPATLPIGVFHQGNSAAPSWTTWNNSAPAETCAYTSTAIVTVSDVVAPPKDQPYCFGKHDFLKHPHHTEQVHEVITNGVGNGIVQAGLTGNYQHTESRVWVFVLRCSVGMGTGNGGGDTPTNVFSTKTYEWEELVGPNGGSPVNEFILYSNCADGAWFFVAHASVIPV